MAKKSKSVLVLDVTQTVVLPDIGGEQRQRKEPQGVGVATEQGKVVNAFETWSDDGTEWRRQAHH